MRLEQPNFALTAAGVALLAGAVIVVIGLTSLNLFLG